MSERLVAKVPSLGKRASGGARSAIIAQVSVQLGSAAATILLARILSPAEFGIVALAQSLMGITTLISLTGVTAAIVTHKGDVRGKASTYFWVAIGIAILFTLTLSLLAGPLAAVLGQPSAAPYVVVLSFSLPLSFAVLVPESLLQRGLHFKRMLAVPLTGSLVYFITEVAFALLGWGAWSVVVGQVVGAAVSCILGFVLAGWLPAIFPRFAYIKDDLGLIANLGARALVAYLGKNIDYWLVSRFLGAASLGVYYIAYVLPVIIRVRLSQIFRQIMLPLVTKLEDEGEQARAWGKALRASLGLGLPILIGIAVVSDPLVAVFFGPQWHQAALPMKLITIAAVADIVVTAVSTMAVARRRLITRSTLIFGLNTVLIGLGALVAVQLRGDLVSVAGAVLAASGITLFAQEIFVSRPLGVGFRELGAEPLRIAAACIVMYLLVDIALRTILQDLGSPVQLAVGVAIGVTTYLVAAYIVARSALVESFKNFRRLVRGV